jgi:hypothetical protein
MIAPLRNHYRSFELRGDLADRVVPAQNRRNSLENALNRQMLTEAKKWRCRSLMVSPSALS